ncbi:hypothetical protein BJX70DRAFT_282640 [Aspergillus crustosus]
MWQTAGYIPAFAGMNPSHSSTMTTLRPEDYTIGWICALPLEMAAAKAMLDEIHEDLPVQPNDHNAYTLGRIGRHNVVMACLPSGEYGTASASTVAMQLLSSFKCIKAGLLVGIGGGIPSEEADIRLGDVVVGLPTSRSTHGGVVQYDLGKAVRDGEFERTGTLNRPPQILMTAVSKLQAIHQMEGSQISNFVEGIGKKYPRMGDTYTWHDLQDRLFVAEYHHQSPGTSCSECDSTRLVGRPARKSGEPVIYHGLIASGNQVVKDSSLRDRLGRELGAYCVEMEAAGLVNNYRCLVIRGICDYADSHKNKGWQGYAAAVAAAYAKELLLVTSTSSADQKATPANANSADKHHDGLIGADSRRMLKKMQACLQSLLPSTIDIPRPVQNGDSRPEWYQMSRNKTFDEWYRGLALEAQNNLIWIKGKPGSGKSTFMRHAFCRAINELKGNGATIAGFFFNGRERSLRWSQPDLFRALLYQLLQADHDELSRFMEFFSHKLQSPDGAEWTKEELKPFLSAMLTGSRSSRTLVFVDGLDECDGDGMRELALFFREITTIASAADTNLSICLSSREYPKISVEQCPEIRIDQLNADDIRHYVHHRLKMAGVIDHTGWPQLESSIVHRSAGVFLWVVIVVDVLLKDWDDGKSFRYLFRHLEETPPALEQLYEQILSTVEEKNIHITLRFFSWVVFANKPLRLVEWHHVLAWIRDKPPESLREWRESDAYTESAWQLEQQIRSISRGLVEVKTRNNQLPIDDEGSIFGEAGSLNSEEGETRTVRVIHSSLAEFFLSGRGLELLKPFTYPGFGDISILTTCLEYIRMCELDALALQRQLAGYPGSVKKLYLQRRQHSPERSDSIASLGSSASFGSSAISYARNQKRSDNGQTGSNSPVLPLADLQKNSVMPDEGNIGPSLLEQFLENAISAAGADAVERAASDGEPTDFKDNLSETLEGFPALLSYALNLFTYHAIRAENDGADPSNVIDRLQRGGLWQRWLYLADTHPHETTLLCFAAETGLNSWIKYLLSKSTNPGSMERELFHALLAAVRNGHVTAAILLLNHGADPCMRDLEGNTLLHVIAERGWDDLLSCYIDSMYRVGAPVWKALRVTFPGRRLTPLHLAVQQGHISIVQRLLELGADPDSVDENEETVLHYACKNGCPKLVICQALLAHGASKNKYNEDMLTPVVLAFQSRFFAAVTLINNHPAMPDSQPRMTVQVTDIVGIDQLTRPYILVSLAAQEQLLHPLENDDWTLGHFSIPEESISYLRLSIQEDEPSEVWHFTTWDMELNFGGSASAKRQTFIDRQSVFQGVGWSEAMTLILEVTVPPGVKIGQTGEVIVHSSRAKRILKTLCCF